MKPASIVVHTAVGGRARVHLRWDLQALEGNETFIWEISTFFFSFFSFFFLPLQGHADLTTLTTPCP